MCNSLSWNLMRVQITDQHFYKFIFVCSDGGGDSDGGDGNGGDGDGADGDDDGDDGDGAGADGDGDGADGDLCL